MKRSVVRSLGIILGVLGIMAILAGCSQGITSSSGQQSNPSSSTGPSSKSNVAYPPKNFSPTASGSTVYLSMAAVAQAGNGRFRVNDMTFMAYQMDGKYYIRSSVCVPCGSTSFTLQNGTLICNTCGTVFSATTGIGVRGVAACMTYAKKAVVYTTDGDNIVMTLTDLTTAYQNTLNRKN